MKCQVYVQILVYELEIDVYNARRVMRNEMQMKEEGVVVLQW